MPEQLALEHPFRDGAAVDGDERPRCPRATGVDGACHQLLAGSALSDDKHGRVGERHPRGGLVDLQHAFTAADHVRERVLLADLPLEPSVFGGEPPVPQRPGHHQLDRVHVVRLGDVIVGAAADRLHRAIDVPERRHQQHRRLRRMLVDPVEHLQAVHIPHADVADHRVELAVALQPLHRLRPVGAGENAVPVLREDLRHQRARGAIVVHHQDARGFRHGKRIADAQAACASASGKRTVNAEPLPGSLSTSMRPRSARAISLQMASPSPVPFPSGLVV